MYLHTNIKKVCVKEVQQTHTSMKNTRKNVRGQKKLDLPMQMQKTAHKMENIICSLAKKVDQMSLISCQTSSNILTLPNSAPPKYFVY